MDEAVALPALDSFDFWSWHISRVRGCISKGVGFPISPLIQPLCLGLGPNIWLEYGQYSVGGIGQKGGLEKVRSVFERALSSVGLHITKGLAIWEAYREFESAIAEAAQVSSPALFACD